jgi:hypothetical protein
MRTRAKESGVRAGTARFMPTVDTEKHVKFSGGGESIHAPANEFLGNRLSDRLGATRPQLWAVELAPELVSREPELAAVTALVGLGVDRMPWTDLSGPAIAQSADDAPDVELLAQHVAMTWLQVQDHADHNFMQDGNRVIVVDFASGPSDAVWEGTAPLGEERPDHGGLGSRLARASDEAKADVRARFEAIGASELDGDLAEMPEEWATMDQRVRLRDELIRVKPGIIRDLL